MIQSFQILQKMSIMILQIIHALIMNHMWDKMNAEKDEDKYRGYKQDNFEYPKSCEIAINKTEAEE